VFSVALCQAASLTKITAFTKYNIRAMDHCNINLNTQDHQASLRLSVLVLFEGKLSELYMWINIAGFFIWYLVKLRE
jgi:hypothetical protein